MRTLHKRAAERARAAPDGDAAFGIAAAWLVLHASASADEAQAFADWLADSPRHRCAWAKAQDLWRLLGDALSDEP